MPPPFACCPECELGEGGATSGCVCGLGFPCPPCAQMGAGGVPHPVHVSPQQAGWREGAPLPGLHTAPGLCSTIAHKAQTGAQMGKGAPFPIPMPPPIRMSRLHRNWGWRGLRTVPSLCAPFARGRGRKREGALLLGLRMPHSRCHCMQGGRGRQFLFPCGSPICMPNVHTNRGKGQAPSHSHGAPLCSSCMPPQRCGPHPHHSFTLPFLHKRGDRGSMYPLHACACQPLFHDPGFRMPPCGEWGTCRKGGG